MAKCFQCGEEVEEPKTQLFKPWCELCTYKTALSAFGVDPTEENMKKYPVPDFSGIFDQLRRKFDKRRKKC